MATPPSHRQFSLLQLENYALERGLAYVCSVMGLKVRGDIGLTSSVAVSINDNPLPAFFPQKLGQPHLAQGPPTLALPAGRNANLRALIRGLFVEPSAHHAAMERRQLALLSLTAVMEPPIFGVMEPRIDS